MKISSTSLLRAILISAITALLALDPSARAQPTVAAEQNGEGPTPALSSLVGKWYSAGDINKVCYVASAGDTFLAVNDLNTPFIVTAAPGNQIFFKPADGHPLAVKVLPNYLLGYGWWWSRSPTTAAN